MKIKKSLKLIFNYVFVLTLITFGIASLRYSNSVNAEELDGYYEDFDDADIGVLQAKNRWALMVYDGQETGVSFMPDEAEGKCLKISNIPDGKTPGGDWMNNSKALTNFEKEVNIISVDFYIPNELSEFSNKDCAFVQLRQSSANFVAFAVYGDGIKEYKTDGSEPQTYKNSIKRGEWINVTCYYYPKLKTFSLYYKEVGSEAELILENKEITPSKWTPTQMTDFRVMSNFQPSNELHYFYIDNINVYATNRLPYLENVVINGVNNEKIGETLEAGFTYHSDLGLDEKNIEIQWYRSTDLRPGDIQGNIEYLPITGATSKTYTTTEADLYHYIYYTAKPIDVENNEGIEYKSGMALIYLDNTINDFESYNVGDSTFEAFQIRSNNTSINVEEANENKFVSVSQNSSNDEDTFFEMESAYQFGLRDRTVCYESDFLLSERIKAGSILSLSFVFNKNSSFFGKSVVEALVFEDNTLYVGLNQKFELPINEWFKLKLYLVKGEKLQYVVQVLDENFNSIYVSRYETITNSLANDLYDSIGVSSVLVRYDSLSNENISKISMDNIALKYADEGIILMGGNLGVFTTRNDFEYDFITAYIGNNSSSSIRFECSDGSLPRGISVIGNQLRGSFTREGTYDFEITATDESENITVSLFHVEVADAYTITFNSNMGSEINSLIVSPNSKIETLEIPTRTGYIFVGWKRENGNFWNKETDLVTANETLTAEWQAKEFLLTYVDFDGTILKTEKVTYKSEIIIPSELSAKNWYLDSDFVEKFSEGLTMPAKNISLYALKIDEQNNHNENEGTGCKGKIMASSLLLLMAPTLYFLKKRKENEISLYNE